MAHYVQAEHIRTRERLAKIEKYPVPRIGSVIIYNEVQKHHEKHDAAPWRGLATVSDIRGVSVVVNQMHKNGNFFTKSIRVTDFRLGLYRFVEISGFPSVCPEFSEIEITNSLGELDFTNLRDDLRKMLLVKNEQQL